MSCEWTICFIRPDIHSIHQDAVTRTMLSIILLQEHGVRWHLVATAEYVRSFACPPSGALVEPKRIIRFATLRRALCIMSLTQTTTWLCCYLCIAPPAGTMLFLSSRPLGRSKYDCPNYAIIFIIGAIVVPYNFFVLCLYHTLSHATAVIRIHNNCSNVP